MPKSPTPWEDNTTPELINAHFGYTDHLDIATHPHGYWPLDTVMDRLPKLTDFLAQEGLLKEKFRIVLDYDPEFPRAMVHVEVNRDPEA